MCEVETGWFSTSGQHAEHERVEGVRTRCEELKTMASSLLSARSSQRICLVCTRKVSKYTCPSCNIPYCSVDCFKKHDSGCTEKFYQKNVMEELHVRNGDETSKKNMIDILRRQAGLDPSPNTRPEDCDDDESAPSSLNDPNDEAEVDTTVLERLQELALKPSLSIGDLTEEEQTKFFRAALGGQLSAQITPWEPWWTTQHPGSDTPAANASSNRGLDPVATAANKTDETVTKVVNGIEHFPMSIPSMKTLCPLRTQFPVQLRHNLVDILCSFSYTLRYHNGDMHSHDPIAAACMLIESSGTCSNDDKYNSLEDAVKSFQTRLRGERVNTDETALASQMLMVLHDTALLLRDLESVSRATKEFCCYLTRAYFLATHWLSAMKYERSKKETAKQGLSLGEPHDVTAYMNDWVTSLEAQGVRRQNCIAEVLKSQRRVLSRIRRKALFYASWSCTLTPTQLRSLRTKLHLVLDDWRAHQRQLSSDDNGAAASLLMSPNSVPRPQNFSITNVPPIREI